MNRSIQFAFLLTALVFVGCNSKGSSDGPTGTIQPPTQTAPATPTGLDATAGDAQVVLIWTASSGATSYHVKRGTTSGGSYTQVGAPTGTTCTDTSLTNGTKYFYVVSAVNSAGESANSSEVSATPVVVNRPPVAALQITPTSGTAPLTVNASTAGSMDPDGTIQSVLINFGDGTTLSAASGSHTYTNPGIYNAIATVTDNDGAIDNASMQVTVISTSGSSPVTPSLVASRTSGYAPLAVFFDATGTASTTFGITNPALGGTFRLIKHSFDFGDPNSGTHSIDGLSKNSEPTGGGLAAHVFDVPGTYTVTVTSTDGVGAPASTSVTIQVDNPSALTTYAISKTDGFTGAPAGSIHLTQSTLPTFASNTRYYFNRGEDWSSENISLQDPLTNVHVDSYGSGANPLFKGVYVGTDRPATTTFASDIRVSNITSNSGFNQENGGQVLFYKCNSYNAESFFGAGYTHVDLYSTIPQSAYTNSYDVFYVDCDLLGDGTVGGLGYGNGSRLVFLNTHMGGASGHTIRIVGWERGVMRHCQVEDPYKDTSLHALKVHAGGPNAYADNWIASGGKNSVTSNYVDWTTSKVVIANNTFGGGSNGPAAAWTVAVCPQNDGYGLAGVEPIEDVILEENKFIHAPGWGGSNRDFAWTGRNLTSRNNTVSHGTGPLAVGKGHAEVAAYDGPYFTD